MPSKTVKTATQRGGSQEPRTTIQVVDFFCGCGGTSAGLRKAGMNILAGIDSDHDSGETFKKNFPDAEFISKDIRRLTPEELSHLFPKKRTQPLLFSACAPCQPFSRQKTTRRTRDTRKSLLDELHKFIKAYKPEYIFLENVPGLQKVSKGPGPLQRFISLLREQKYHFDDSVLLARDYGVPQHRQRYVLIASLTGQLKLPEPTHGKERKYLKYETAWAWIKDLPPIAAGEIHPTVKNHRAAALSAKNLKRIGATPIGGSRKDWPKHLKLDCHVDYDGHTDVYGRIHKHKPAAAMTTRCISLSNGRYGHPIQNRAISVREAARLQTFGDSFIFTGNLNSMARQIGNAVPVKMAEVFGRHIKRHFKHHVSKIKSGGAHG